MDTFLEFLLLHSPQEMIEVREKSKLERHHMPNKVKSLQSEKLSEKSYQRKSQKDQLFNCHQISTKRHSRSQSKN